MKSMNNSASSKVIAEFNKTKTDNNKRVSREQILDWMKSDDIEILGAVYSYCTNPDYYTKVDPNLTVDDYYQFVKLYFKRCFIENPSGDWTETRYEAGWSLVNWFKSYWKDKNSLPSDYVSELKAWLAEIYISGDDNLRLCICTSVLEHMFSDLQISEFFSDWLNDPVLKQAYDEAMGRAGKLKGP